MRSKVDERAGVLGSIKAPADKQDSGKALLKTVVMVSDLPAGKAAGGKVQPSGKVAGGGKQPTLIVPNETQLMASRNVSRSDRLDWLDCLGIHGWLELLFMPDESTQ